MFEQSAGADAGLLRKSERLSGWGDGGVGVAGQVEGDVFGASGSGGCDGGSVVGCCEAFVGLLAAAEEKGGHQEDAADEAPEENALVAGDHFAAPAASWWLRQEVRAAAMALAIFC